MSIEHIIDAPRPNPDAGFWPPERGRFRLRFKKPKDSNGLVFGFWYRVVIAIVCTIPAWLALIIMGAFNDYSLEPWMFIVAVSLSIVPLLVAEILRRSVFERALRVEAETVELKISRTGVELTAADHRDLETFESRVSNGSNTIYRLFGKRLLDVSLSVVLLVLMSPVLAIIAIFISRDGHSPIYLQRRVGMDGREFKVLKFRTMVPNAEESLLNYLNANPEARAEWDTVQKLKHDPRITPLGTFLRKTSLDELPQLLNVLRGDMSLVGPRPIMCSIPDDRISPRRSALFMARSVLRDVRDGVRPC